MADTLARRGFVTVATGSDKYYELAVNLLRSYRLLNSDDSPFCLICDREHPMAAGFDHVVIMEKAYSSYLDKLQLGRYSPYGESIFVDADALFLRDPALLWEDFTSTGDFSCYGSTVAVDSPAGWYDNTRLGEFQEAVTFGVKMHGGLYYFRKTEECAAVFQRSIHLAENFSQYSFHYFEKPADEPVLALAMAASGWEPCPDRGRILFLPTVEKRLSVTRRGQLRLDKAPTDAVIIHFTTGNTRRFLYHFLLDGIRLREENPACENPGANYWPLRRQFLPYETVVLTSRKVRKFVPTGLWKKLRGLVK